MRPRLRREGTDVRFLSPCQYLGGIFDRAWWVFKGPGTQWVDELLPLVVDDGVGTFILASDDPRTMEQFVREVAPALREAGAAWSRQKR